MVFDTFFTDIDEKINKRPLSIYIHWPYCLSKCPYCDFNSHVSAKIDHELWLSSYIKELEFFNDYFIGRPIHSIFFGGGTPSLMEPRVVNTLLDYISSKTRFDQNIEITMEANPTSRNEEKFLAFRNAGINRISIGIQSLIPEDLKFLGREHSVEGGLDAIEMARKIFPRYSIDLIYCRPNQTLESWKEELTKALKLADDHVSLYQLTIEKGTKFHSMYKQKAFTLPEDDLSNDLYFLTDKILAEYGFEKYEVSNYAKDNNYCKHNMCYWNYDDYLGIGPGAHSRLYKSHEKFYAFNTIYNPNQWLKTINENSNAIQKLELLKKSEVLSEIILMGLRLSSGIDQQKAINKLGNTIQNFIKPQTLSFLQNEDLIEYDEQKFSTTEKGFRLLDYITRTLINNLIIDS